MKSILENANYSQTIRKWAPKNKLIYMYSALVKPSDRPHQRKEVKVNNRSGEKRVGKRTASA